MSAANTLLLIPYYHKSEKDTNTTHCYSTSVLVYIVLTCVLGRTMTGSHQTTTSGPVRTSPRRTKVGESTAKVRKRSNTSESRRNLNGRPRGREIATIPYPTVHVHTDDEEDDEEDDHLQKPMGKEIVSSTEGATKRKKRPAGKKKKRVPEVHGSTYDDDTNKGDRR